ncbi:MAG: PHP domain-containing protein [Bacilli bacterium]|nr:PHP domain-containing protein [Bacilli bacterium]
MEEEIKRVELCVHTSYSMRKGIGSPTDVVKAAKELGIEALAICDDYNTAGYFEFFRACKTNNIKPIYGVTINIEGNRIVVLAKNKNGVPAINKIISISTPEDDLFNCQNKLDDLLNSKEDLITIGVLNDSCDNFDFLLKNFNYVGITERNKLNFADKSISKVIMRKLIAISDSYYINKGDKLLFDALQNNYSKEYRFLKNGNDLLNSFPSQLVFENPKKIYEKIEENVFEGYAAYFDFPNLINEDDFRKLVKKCIKNRHEFKLENYASRLDLELESVIKHKYWNLFYIAYKIAEFAKKKKELVGCRGSASSALLSYALGITAIDPIEWNIPCQTFLGFDLDKMPDIDLNVSVKLHDEIFEFLQVLVGEFNVVRAGSLYTLTDYNASYLVTKYVQNDKHYYDSLKDTNTFKLMDTVVELGMHPGGFMLKSTNNDFYKYTAIKNVYGMPTTVTDFRNLHDSILKMDVLGHIDLDLFRTLEKKTGIKYEDVPIDDPQVLSLLQNSKALNKKKIINPDGNPLECISEFGSEFMYSVIKKSKPKTINDLIKVSGLGHGTGTWIDNAELLIKDGHTLEDVIGCRDDVFNILTQKYGVNSKIAFAIMEDVRKGRGIKEVYADALRVHEVPDYLIQSMDKIKYAFPKGHAVYYVINALKQAYYKVYYPKEFYTAYFDADARKEVLAGILSLSNEEFTRKSESNGFNSEELKLISNMFDMIERGYFFENKEEINVIETDVVSLFN